MDEVSDRRCLAGVHSYIAANTVEPSGLMPVEPGTSKLTISGPNELSELWFGSALDDASQ